MRECAEAQSKDFGLIATDKGWNGERIFPTLTRAISDPWHSQCSSAATEEPTRATLTSSHKTSRRPRSSGSLIASSVPNFFLPASRY